MSSDAGRFALSTPGAADLPRILHVLGDWQIDGGAVHLHPGDVGWFGRFGPDATAAALRVWSDDGRFVAVGLLDGDDILRLALAPGAHDDASLAAAIAADVRDPARGVLPEGPVAVEARSAPLLRSALLRAGWTDGEAWVPLIHPLTGLEPSGPALRIEVVDPQSAHDRVAVHRSGFPTGSTSLERWFTMAAGPAYSAAHCLTAYDGDGNAVAAVTVWSAGVGRPGVIEPLAVHEDHRGRGYGTAIARAGARALRGMGSSRAIVATPASNEGAVATYVAAGFERMPDSLDVARTA